MSYRRCLQLHRPKRQRRWLLQISHHRGNANGEYSPIVRVPRLAWRGNVLVAGPKNSPSDSLVTSFFFGAGDGRQYRTRITPQ